MAPRHPIALLIALAIGSSGCIEVPEQTEPPWLEARPGTTGGSSNSWCSSLTFVGDLHGAQATAKLNFEPLHEIGYVSGTIASAHASYSFYGDTPIDVYTKWPTSSVMWVDVTGLTSGERFRAEINWKAEGFVFTANPFGGGGATDYYFHCSH